MASLDELLMGEEKVDGLVSPDIIVFGDQNISDEYRALDPRNIKPFNIGAFTYPTLLHYLLSEVIAYFVADYKAQISNMSLEDLLTFSEAHLRPYLEGLNNNIPEMCQLWAGVVQQAMAVAKPILFQNTTFYVTLKKTYPNKLVYFLNIENTLINNILGNVCGYNVYGGGLEILRNSENANLPSLAQTTNLSVIKKWIEKKCKDTSRCVGLFFGYLTLTRDNYEKVAEKIIERKGQSNLIDPILTPDMVNYVINHIFNCSVSSHLIPGEIPKDKAELCRNTILESSKTINDKLSYIEINNNIIQKIWNYVASLTDTIALGVNTQEEFNTKISNNERAILFANDYEITNWGFNMMYENALFQAILNVSISLCDWLDLSIIGLSEILTSVAIIFPEKYYGDLKDVNNTFTKESNITSTIEREYLKLGFYIDKNAVALFEGVMNFYSKKLEEFKVNEKTLNDTAKITNRVVFFATN